MSETTILRKERWMIAPFEMDVRMAFREVFGVHPGRLPNQPWLKRLCAQVPDETIMLHGPARELYTALHPSGENGLPEFLWKNVHRVVVLISALERMGTDDEIVPQKKEPGRPDNPPPVEKRSRWLQKDYVDPRIKRPGSGSGRPKGAKDLKPRKRRQSTTEEGDSGKAIGPPERSPITPGS
jgi:hypothetical protein